MGRRPRIGDKVSLIGSSRVCLIVDVDRSDYVTVSWKPSPERWPVEAKVHRTGLYWVEDGRPFA